MLNSPIASAYDQIAERWRDDRFDNQNGIACHSRALGFLPVPVSGRALNVGCGCNTRFNTLIKSGGLMLEGIDISPRMIELAQTADPNTPVYLADVCSWQPRYHYAFITAWDSIWHVPLSRQRAVMLSIMSCLEPGGIFLFSAGGLDSADEHSNNFMGPEVYHATLGVTGILDVIKEAHCRCRHLEYDQYPEQHLVVIAQKVA